MRKNMKTTRSKQARRQLNWNGGGMDSQQWRLVGEFTGGSCYGSIKMGLFCVSRTRDTTIHIREIVGVMNF